MKSIFPILHTVLTNNSFYDWPRYSIKAIIWQVRKKLGHSFKTKLGNGSVIKVYPSTAYSGIFYSSNPEGDDFIFLRRHSNLADTFVDVGANVGLFSASLFECFRKVICFEPAPSTYRALAETCALNPQVNCELYNIGVGDVTGELHFESEFEFSTTSRFVPEANTHTISVPVDTLDHVLGEVGEPMVMKIDVEGYEEKVFAGADKLFTSKQVKLVMFERLGRTNLDTVCNFLEQRGYTVFRVVRGGCITTDVKEMSEPCINLFACPEQTFHSL